MLYEIKNYIKNKNYRGALFCMESLLPPKLVSNIKFYRRQGRLINYKMPTLLDEKLLVIKDGTYRNNKLVTLCTDKFAVREYVKEKNLEWLLNELIGVYQCTEDIDWDALPKSFVIKCNHGCGYNIIVRDKGKLDKLEAYSKLNHWMKEDYSVIAAELHYHSIQRKIMIEKLIETKDDNPPMDYRFYCSKGNVIFTRITTMKDGRVDKIYNVDRDFQNIEIVKDYIDAGDRFVKPIAFDKMISVAEELSVDFPFVRVDLYNENGNIIFGELTFTPGGCYHSLLGEDAQIWIGDQISL